MQYQSRSTIRFILCLFALILIVTQGCATRTVSAPPAPDMASEANALSPSDTLSTSSQAEALAAGEADLEAEESLSDDGFFPEGDDFEDEFADEFEAETAPRVSDPLAPFNRAMFTFNDALLIWIIKPVALGYRAITPVPVRKGVGNFFTNLKMPIRLLNSILQGKITGAGREVGRFVVNTTVGVLGFGDPAAHWLGMAPSNEDIGQTLGLWGVGNGCYIVWPIFGPSTLRDSFTIAETIYLNPVSYVQPKEYSLALSAFEKINVASFSIQDYETLKKSALDPYTLVRDLYIQTRDKSISE